MLVYPDGKKNTAGQILMGEHYQGNGRFRKLQIHVPSQTPHTQAGSGYTQLHPVIECCVEVQEVYLDLSLLKSHMWNFET